MIRIVMWKHVDVIGCELGLVITGATPEVALPEMEAVGPVDFVAVGASWVQGTIRFQTTNAALDRAKELVANGWNWGGGNKC